MYVNYLYYDIAAHAFGPESGQAIRALRRLDRAIRQIWRRLERWIFDEFLDREGAGARDDRARSGLARGLRAHRRAVPGVFQRFLNYLDEDFITNRDPEADEKNGIRVISAGPNAFLYVLDAPQPLDAEALEHRLPGLAEEL